MNNICWLDLETTGTNPQKHTIVQLAAAIEINGEIVDTFNRWMQPLVGYDIEEEALKVMGKTLQEISVGEDPLLVYKDFYAFLAKYGYPKQKDKRYIPAGYNVRFDLDFLSQWFNDISEGPYAYWDMLQFNGIDPCGTIISLWRLGKLPGLKDCKLATVCEFFGIPLQAHDALSDLMATRTLAREIYSTFIAYDGKKKE